MPQLTFFRLPGLFPVVVGCAVGWGAAVGVGVGTGVVAVVAVGEGLGIGLSAVGVAEGEVVSPFAGLLFAGAEVSAVFWSGYGAGDAGRVATKIINANRMSAAIIAMYVYFLFILGSGFKKSYYTIFS